MGLFVHIKTAHLFIYRRNLYCNFSISKFRGKNDVLAYNSVVICPAVLSRSVIVGAMRKQKILFTEQNYHYR